MNEDSKSVLLRPVEIDPPTAAGEKSPAMATLGRLWRRHDKTILSIVSIGTFLIIWELLPRLGLVKPHFTSSPSRIAAAFVTLMQDGFWYDISLTLTEFTLGLGLAILVGIPFGMMMGWNRSFQAIFNPFITTLYAVPRIALTPLLILWLGIGLRSTVALVFLGAVFPIIVNVFSGMNTLDEALVRCARAFGAGDRQVLRTVALPSSVPFMVAGIRLAVGRALVGVIVAEFVASRAGIGHMMARAGATFQTDKVFVGVILLSLLGLTLTGILNRLEARFDAWRPHRNGGGAGGN
jgi:NitT/TauT family transport system permease protein